MHSPVENSTTTTTLPNNILLRILESLYVDFLESVESSISEHHCSLLHPCNLISKSTEFNVFYNFRLVASEWNQVFIRMAKLDRYAYYQIIQGPRNYQTRIYTLLRKSVIFGRYRVFHTLDTVHDHRGVFVAYDFGVTGGCKEPREVIIKAWKGYSEPEDCEIERRAYSILSASPMRGFPSLIEDEEDSDHRLYGLVLEKLGPSLEDLYQLIPGKKRFDEKMILALAIQMLDRYAALHASGIIHNGAKPANICMAAPSSSVTDASTLNLIDFGCSFFVRDRTPLHCTTELSGNKRFWSALSYHMFTQSQRDDLESLGYLFSALYQGSLPWDEEPYNIWRVKMSTPASTLFRGMDPSFLEYWKDVRTLAFAELPDYCSLKSRFVQCWERKGFGNSPGEYDWLALFNRLQGGIEEKESPVPVDKPVETSSLSAATSVIAPGSIDTPSQSAH